MILLRYKIENYELSKDQLLKIYDLVINTINSFFEDNYSYEIMSKGNEISADEFKSLATDLRNEIQLNWNEEDGKLRDVIDEYLPQNSIFNGNRLSVEEFDLEEDDWDDIELSDSLYFSGEMIWITFLDPAEIDYHKRLISGAPEDFIDKGIITPSFRQEGIRDYIQIEVKDEYGGYNCI